jgi:hypothetical protein
VTASRSSCIIVLIADDSASGLWTLSASVNNMISPVDFLYPWKHAQFFPTQSSGLGGDFTVINLLFFSDNFEMIDKVLSVDESSIAITS